MITQGSGALSDNPSEHPNTAHRLVTLPLIRDAAKLLLQTLNKLRALLWGGASLGEYQEPLSKTAPRSASKLQNEILTTRSVVALSMVAEFGFGAELKRFKFRSALGQR